MPAVRTSAHRAPVGWGQGRLPGGSLWVHAGMVERKKPAQGRPSVSPESESLADRTLAADEREKAADERQHKADERERIAAAREREANERERDADERQCSADERERELVERQNAFDERARSKGHPVETADRHALEYIARARELLALSAERLSREEGV